MAFPLLIRNVYAFYEHETDEYSLDLRGLIRGFGMAWKNPENQYFYEDRSDSGLAGLARLMAQAKVDQHLSFEANIYQTYIPTVMASSRGGISTSLDVERSAALEKSYSNDTYTHLAVDRLNAHWSQDRLDLTVGRQPINLATTFYFTPNDFFAPFAAQTFYRVYKPGVDAARVDVRLADLSQFSLMSVLGYKRDSESDTGWSDEPETDRISYLARLSTVFHDFDWVFLGGVVRDTNIIGGALQGEVFQWLGIRAEGHWADPDEPQEDPYSLFSVGFEHRWENSLNIRWEQFHNGQGTDSVSDYGRSYFASQNQKAYLAKDYTALGLGYEFTPLFNGEFLIINNWVDDSYLFSANAVYSLSDEAELAVNVTTPFGEKPNGPEIRSEFGLYPTSVNLEVRWYF
jgi:hypothetical protein